MNEVTLKSALNRVILVTLALVGITTISALYGYCQIKRTLSTNTISDGLLQSSRSQIESLIPSFLLPEQKSGARLLLDRFKESDGLTDIWLLEPGDALPKDFSACKLSTNQNSCRNSDGSKLALISPVIESGRTLGFLLKAKPVGNPLANDHLLQMIEFGSGILVLTFFVLFLLLSRVTAKEVPAELGNLVSWIESTLSSDNHNRAPTLKFKELNDLGAKITELIGRHEQERAQAVVGQLTSGIMHDIKTPLHSIVTAFQLVNEQERDTPKRVSRLENLLSVCAAKLPIIGDIIETTLDGARAIHIDPTDCDLRQTIDAAIELHNASLTKRQLRLEVQGLTTPILVAHDPVQLGRVFANVIRNSIDAIPPHPERRAGSAEIRISIEKPTHNEIHVAFEDAGFGMPENPEKVFRLFRSSKPRGSGLGLVIARKIVEAHSGRITAAHSDELSGARFDVFLPTEQISLKANSGGTSCQ